MTYIEIDEAIIRITRRICDECKVKLDSIPKENTTERKAVLLEHGMYVFCRNAGLLANCTGRRENCIKTRQHFLNDKLPVYPDLHKKYSELDENDKLNFVAALQAEIFLRDQWLKSQCAELSEAVRSGEAAKIFELKIKIGAVKNMFKAWEKWRRDNNIYPFMFDKEDI